MSHDAHQSHDAPRGGASTLAEFRDFRERMNREILDENNLVVNRFFALDGRAYEAGALDVKTKELLGLVASLVLRCDDCITYHVVRCKEEGVTDAQFFEAFNVGLVVGGSIVSPQHPELEALRTEFPILRTRTYLNSCSLGALSNLSMGYLGEYQALWNTL